MNAVNVAALSVAMSNHQVRESAGLAIMNKSMGVMEQQSQQLMDMLKTSGPEAPHPSLGKLVDFQA
ncbi:YjfB family protein [Virgibacillus sp. DJP39]|uniref:YjfB family protein n=1 Tax=Virgibacillus sp. DJP39 TaxID=3409790 RepID=UPI003BB5C91C